MFGVVPLGALLDIDQAYDTHTVQQAVAIVCLIKGY